MTEQNPGEAPAQKTPAQQITEQFCREYAKRTVEFSSGVALWQGGIVTGAAFEKLKAKEAQDEAMATYAGNIAFTAAREDAANVIVFLPPMVAPGDLSRLPDGAPAELVSVASL